MLEDMKATKRLKGSKFELTSESMEEELMAVCYMTLLFKLFEKKTEAMKALKEYSAKEKISLLGLANLQKLKAIMIISQKQENIADSMKMFEEAVRNFEKLDAQLGVAIGKLALFKLLVMSSEVCARA